MHMMENTSNKTFLKYTTYYILPLVLLSALLSYVIFVQDAKTFFAVMKNNEMQILEFQGRIITEHLKHLEEDIEYISKLRTIKRYTDSGFNPEINIATQLLSFMERRKIYSSVRIIDSGGFERLRINNTDGKAEYVDFNGQPDLLDISLRRDESVTPDNDGCSKMVPYYQANRKR